MERKHSPGLYELNVADQIVIIRVIRERKCCVDLVPINRVWVDGPATHHRHAFVWKSFQHVRPIRAGWTAEDSSRNIVRVATHVSAKLLTEPPIDARYPINRPMRPG